jgi:hypothetical protein
MIRRELSYLRAVGGYTSIIGDSVYIACSSAPHHHQGLLLLLPPEFLDLTKDDNGDNKHWARVLAYLSVFPQFLYVCKLIFSISFVGRIKTDIFPSKIHRTALEMPRESEELGCPSHWGEGNLVVGTYGPCWWVSGCF